MRWDEGLLPEQQVAAAHIGSDAVLIAGPGTGKTHTLIRRVIRLCQEEDVRPRDILALTFTRAAMGLLKQEARRALGAEAELPHVSTLHSYALSQLLQSREAITTLPQPLRIADDWEERYIIFEDLKRLLNSKIPDIRERFARLSADWQTLDADAEDWDTRYADPEFLAAWREHRQLYGYTVRAELVYQLKRATERIEGFEFARLPRHLFVDEYQDLNRCDLAVVRAVVNAGAELYAAGDDDQSIYGFRKALPEGIRRFAIDYEGSRRFDLTKCRRCDQRILDIGDFVARLDPRRLAKTIVPWPDARAGEVRLLRFDNDAREADCVARICKWLIASRGTDPAQILILLRSDRHRVFSGPLSLALRTHDVPVAVNVETEGPLESIAGRGLVAFLRLVLNPRDSLAWRALLELRTNRIGETTFDQLNEQARRDRLTFAGALQRVRRAVEDLPRMGGRIAAEVTAIEDTLARFPALDTSSGETGEAAQEALAQWLQHIAAEVIDDLDVRRGILEFLEATTQSTGCQNLEDLLRALAVSDEMVEQELDPTAINILTMHKAKGLGADVVFVVAAEDEYVPGRNAGGDSEGDERRLLYVSLTRARHWLFMTYCAERRGQQRHTGSTAGRSPRTLTRFLQDAPIAPEPGLDFVERLEGSKPV